MADHILSAEASARAGYPVAIHVIHDGTAAALSHAGPAHSVVVVLGTALGAGFLPMTGDGLCAVAFDNAISDPPNT